MMMHLPLPVIRERAGVRVTSIDVHRSQFEITLTLTLSPAYRERGP